jgi:hypothetical protein
MDEGIVALHVDLAPPFGEAWRVPDAEAGFQLEPGEMERIDDLAQSAAAVFAAQGVDGSLVLVLQIGKARLLLPGDAEWGTWKRILQDDDARTLVRGATFSRSGVTAATMPPRRPWSREFHAAHL